MLYGLNRYELGLIQIRKIKSLGPSWTRMWHRTQFFATLPRSPKSCKEFWAKPTTILESPDKVLLERAKKST